MRRVVTVGLVLLGVGLVTMLAAFGWNAATADQADANIGAGLLYLSGLALAVAAGAVVVVGLVGLAVVRRRRSVR